MSRELRVAHAVLLTSAVHGVVLMLLLRGMHNAYWAQVPAASFAHCWATLFIVHGLFHSATGRRGSDT